MKALVVQKYSKNCGCLDKQCFRSKGGVGFGAGVSGGGSEVKVLPLLVLET